MTTQPWAHAEILGDVARRLPPEHVKALAEAVASGELGSFERAVGVASVRDSCREVAGLLASGAEARSLALALLTAMGTAVRVRQEQDVQVVWTGPDSTHSAGRLTTVVLPALIDNAREHILLVSYAAHPTANLRTALDSAVQRQVAITLLLERPSDNPAYSGPGDPFAGLRARRITWPIGQRPVGAALHAKLLVIDRHSALVGSANLTGRAETTNLECGVLLRGGPRPGQLRDHVEDLLRLGVLSQVTGWGGH